MVSKEPMTPERFEEMIRSIKARNVDKPGLEKFYADLDQLAAWFRAVAPVGVMLPEEFGNWVEILKAEEAVRITEEHRREMESDD